MWGLWGLPESFLQHTHAYGTLKIYRDAAASYPLIFRPLRDPSPASSSTGGAGSRSYALRAKEEYEIKKKRDTKGVRFYLSSRTVAHQVLSALCSLTSVFGMGTGGPCTLMKRTLSSLSLLCPHLPIFPDSRPSSIVGTTQLNFCVRYGNRWTLRVNDTNWCTFRDSNPGPTD